MSLGNATELDFLRYALRGTAIPWDAITNVFVALHTADPGEAGDQTTSETNYTGYSRVAVARGTGGWANANPMTNSAAVVFGVMSSGSPVTITHVSIGTLTSGAGQILWKGALSGSVVIAVGGSAPTFAIAALSAALD